MKGHPFEARRWRLILKLRIFLLFRDGQNTAQIARAIGQPEWFVWKLLGQRSTNVHTAIDNVRYGLKKQREKEWRKAA